MQSDNRISPKEQILRLPFNSGVIPRPLRSRHFFIETYYQYQYLRNVEHPEFCVPVRIIKADKKITSRDIFREESQCELYIFQAYFEDNVRSLGYKIIDFESRWIYFLNVYASDGKSTKAGMCVELAPKVKDLYASANLGINYLYNVDRDLGYSTLDSPENKAHRSFTRSHHENHLDFFCDEPGLLTDDEYEVYFGTPR